MELDGILDDDDDQAAVYDNTDDVSFSPNMEVKGYAAANLACDTNMCRVDFYLNHVHRTETVMASTLVYISCINTWQWWEEDNDQTLLEADEQCSLLVGIISHYKSW